MVRLTALRNIKHNGKRYESGDVFDASPAHARPLVELGAAEAVPEPPKEPPQTTNKAAPKRRSTTKRGARK